MLYNNLNNSNISILIIFVMKKSKAVTDLDFSSWKTVLFYFGFFFTFFKGIQYVVLPSTLGNLKRILEIAN